MKYSIIIPTYNHFEDALEPCLSSIFKYTNLDDFQLIIVANGCSATCIKNLCQLEFNLSNVKVVVFDSPIGYTKAINEGLKFARGEYIIFMNNDTVLLEQPENLWLELMTEPFLKDELMGLTGPAKHFDEITGQYFIIFFLAMTKKSVIDKIGKLNEVFNPGFGEDIDFGIRVQKAGLKIARVPVDTNNINELNQYSSNFPIYHAAEKTVHDKNSKIKEIFGLEWEDIVKRNNQTLKELYPKSNYVDKLKNLDEQLYQTLIVQNEYHLQPNEIEGKTVIDIGANVGFFTAKCLDMNAKKVIAVEPAYTSYNRLYNLFKDDKRVITLFDAVVSSENDGKLLYLTNETTGGKLTEEPTNHPVFTITLEKIIPENENNLILKMDCEGSEYEIIKNTSKETLRKFQYIHIEIHEKEPLENYIISCGFKVVDFKQYSVWEENQNQEIINKRLIDTKIFKFERVEENAFSNKLVAVIMPVYNAESFLKDTLNGILLQTHHNFKLFAFNDGSTDSSYEILKKYASIDNRIVVINGNEVIKNPDYIVSLNKRSNGSAHSRNQALDFALKNYKFDFIAYCDSDDIWYSNHLSDSLKILNEKNADMVYSDCQARNDQGIFGDMYGIPYYDEFDKEKLQEQNFIFISTVVHKANVLPQEWFDGNCMPKEDWDMWLRIAKSNTIVHNPNKTVIYLYKTQLSYYNEAQSDLAIGRVKDKNQGEIEYSIIIPTYNRCDELLKPCIESIITNTDLSNVEVIVVANGCTDNTKEYVTNLGKPFKLIWADEKLGYPKATNLGLKSAKGKYLVLLNNDAVLIKQEKNTWLEMMKKPFEQYGQVGMTGPMLFKGIPDISTDFIMFFCAMTSKEVIDKIGILDESFSPGGVEDVDFGIRMHIEGYQLIQVPNSDNLNPINGINNGGFPIFHPGGTTVRNEPDWDGVLIRNNNKLKKKFPQYFKGIEWIEDMEAKEEKKYKIFDCFSFFNELELLEIRLEELYDFVDYFIITEALHTHSGKPKPLYFSDNAQRFEKYKDKIIVQITDFHPEETNSWGREHYQRDVAKDILKQFANDEDYIIISDLDEIPKISAIQEYIDSKTDSIGILLQDRFMFYLNYKNVTTDEPQLNTKIIKYKLLKPDNLRLTYFRYCTKHNELPYEFITNGGWHFTFMGGLDKVVEKIESFAHQEYDTPERKKRIQYLIEQGKDIYDANTTWETVDIDNTFPKLIVEKKQHYETIGWIKSSKPKIYDCFMFYNEIDILEIRLNELYDVVDKFVLVEARETHAGKPKPLYFLQYKDRLAKFLDKIEHIVVNNFPHIITKSTDINEVTFKAHERDHYQRDYIMNGLVNCNNNDIILISDVDEIPRKEVIKQYDGIRALEQDMYYYNFNCKADIKWSLAKILSYGDLRKTTPTQVRNSNQTTISNAGWHFSYFGGIDNVLAKIEASAHQENNTDYIKNKETLSRLIFFRQDIFGRENIYSHCEIDDSYPKYVIEKYGVKNELEKIHSIMKSLHKETYDEIFLIDVYKMEQSEIKNKIIIDIGANYGFFAMRCLELGAKEIHCFEPESNNFKTLKDLTGSYDNIKIYPVAVLDGSINQVHMHSEATSSSIFGDDDDETVSCISLKEAIEGINSNDMVLKLDCEGSEFEIIFNSPISVLHRFKTIYAEFHDKMNPNFIDKSPDLIKYIESIGYKITGRGPQHGHWFSNNTFEPSPVYCFKFERIN